MQRILLLISAITIFHLSPAQGQSNEPFRVGLVLPLTGNAADYGIAIKNGFELAKTDKPELFSNLRFFYEDAAYDPKTAVAALSKVVENDKVDLAVTWGVSFCKALAPIAEARKIPLVGICLDPTVAANKRYVLRFKNTTDEIMRAQAERLAAKGVKKIGLFLAEHPYLEEIALALQRNLQPGQTLTILDQIPNNEMDLRTNILKIAKRNDEFDSLGVFLFVGQISMFYKQMAAMKVSLPTFGSDFFESLSEIRSSEGTMNGVEFASIEVRLPFLNRYREIYKNESQLSFGAPAYELAMVIGELFNGRSRRLTADEIINRFSTVTFREGTAAGPYRYVNDPKAGQYFQFPMVIKRVVGSSFEVLR